MHLLDLRARQAAQILLAPTLLASALLATPLAAQGAPDPALLRVPLPTLASGGPGGGTAVVLGGRDGSDFANPLALAMPGRVRVRVLHAESRETRTRDARVEIALAGDYGGGEMAGIGIALGERRRRFGALETGLPSDSIVGPTYIDLGFAVGSERLGWHLGVGVNGTAVEKGKNDQVNQFTYTLAGDWQPLSAFRLTALTRPASIRTGDVPTRREVVAAAEVPHWEAPLRLTVGGGVEGARLVSGGAGAAALRASLFAERGPLRLRGGAERDEITDRTRATAWNAGASLTVRGVRVGVGRRFAPRGSAVGDVTTVLVGPR